MANTPYPMTDEITTHDFDDMTLLVEKELAFGKATPGKERYVTVKATVLRELIRLARERTGR